MKLPEIRHDFSHARVSEVVIGPRRELLLAVQTLHFDGATGHYDVPMRVRFGGIVNKSEVEAFFANSPYQQSELSSLRYDGEIASKPGQLFIEIIFERIEARLVIQCAHLTINDEETDI